MGLRISVLYAIQDFADRHQRLELLLCLVQICEILCQKVDHIVSK
jgi:hypothetical protein